MHFPSILRSQFTAGVENIRTCRIVIARPQHKLKRRSQKISSLNRQISFTNKTSRHTLGFIIINESITNKSSILKIFSDYRLQTEQKIQRLNWNNYRMPWKWNIVALTNSLSITITVRASGTKLYKNEGVIFGQRGRVGRAPCMKLERTFLSISNPFVSTTPMSK